jgi:hypothetical protein
MARAILNRRNIPLPIGVRTEEPGLVVEPQPYWSPAKGVDLRSRDTRVSKEHASDALNMYVRDGHWRSRNGVTYMGAAGSSTVGIVKFITSTGVAYLIRFRASAAQYWDGTAWQTLAGSYSLTGGATDLFTWTVFDDKLIFSNGVDGLFEFDPVRGSVVLLDGDISAKHLTSFAGRVIASNVLDPSQNTQRIKWCVKGDHTDWEGIGSGFEDLLNVPGGQVDEQGGVFPVDDTRALIVRSKSIWQMVQTGAVDTPFRFTRMLAGKGTEAPHSVAVIPGGIIYVGIDSVNIVTLSDYKDIGYQVSDEILDNVTDAGMMVGDYDPDENEYWVLVPVSGSTIVYRYRLAEDAWSLHTFDSDIVWLHYARGGTVPLTIDGLDTFESQIDDLDDSFDSIDEMLGAADNGAGFLLSSVTRVVYDDPTSQQDDFGGGGADQAIRAVTGAVSAGSALHNTNILEVTLVYECSASQTLIFEYSVDGGSTWVAYGQEAITATTKPVTLKVRKTVSGYNYLVRMRAATLGALRVHAMVPHVVLGTPVQDNG